MAEADPDRPSKSQRLLRSKAQRLGSSKSERLPRSVGRYDPVDRGTGRMAALPPEPASLVGCWLAERFEVGESLRSGPLSEIYRGVDLSQAGGIAEDRVTIRVLHEHLHQRDPGLAARVLATASALCALKHPRILQARECDVDQGLPYLVLDHQRGKSLADFLREAGGPLPLAQALGIARQIAQALDEAHSAGLVHQELSTACVFVEEGPDDLQVTLSDFALVSPDEATELDLGPPNLNASRYASPERAAGQRQEERSDLYALGLILYECLAGQLPFQGFFAEQVLKARLGERIPPVSERAPEVDLPYALVDVLERVLSPEIGERYSSARGLLKALDAAAAAAEAEASLPPPEPLDVVQELSLPGLDSTHRVSLTREGPGLTLTWLFEAPRGRDLASFEEALAKTGAVEHPGLVPLSTRGARGPREWIARSPWLSGPGESARAQLQRGPLKEVALIRRLRPVLEGLAAAHAAGLSHGMIDPCLVEFGRHPRLHGLGVVSAARGLSSLPTVDVRDTALLLLQLLAGMHLEEAGVEGVRSRGLAQAGGKLREALQTATGSSPYPNLGAMLEVIDLDPRFRARSPLPLVAGGLLALIVVAFLAYLAAPSGAPAASPSPSPSASQLASPPAPRPSPTPQPVRRPSPSPSSSPSLATPSPSPSPSSSRAPAPSPSPTPAVPAPSPPLGPPPPGWFGELAPERQPPLPLPPGLRFGKEPETYLLVVDGSLLVWVPSAAVFVGRYEVTWTQFRAYVAASGALPPDEAFAVARDHPVHNVSWKDARAYARWAGARLPSGAEWQAAAGGGRWPWGGQSPDATYANLAGDLDGYAYTSPVGSFPRGVSPAGCFDLAGNVAEWIADAEGDERGVRGGGWFGYAWDARVAWRGRAAPEQRFDFVGFRLALSPRK